MLAFGTEEGRILLTASVTGLRAFKSLGAYGVTKAGIMHMARVLAVELGEAGITVNAICPGATVTERTREIGTIRALGLRRLHQSVIHEDTPVIRGMVFKVKHLVQVEEVEA